MTQTAPDCIFCRIINKEVPATIIAETDDIIVIKDIAPKAPIHWLIIPKKHIRDLQSLREADRALACNMLFMAQQLSQQLPSPGHFRIISNNGAEAGQHVFHIHLHFLSGARLEF